MCFVCQCIYRIYINTCKERISIARRQLSGARTAATRVFCIEMCISFLRKYLSRHSRIYLALVLEHSPIGPPKHRHKRHHRRHNALAGLCLTDSLTHSYKRTAEHTPQVHSKVKPLRYAPNKYAHPDPRFEMPLYYYLYAMHVLGDVKEMGFGRIGF